MGIKDTIKKILMGQPQDKQPGIIKPIREPKKKNFFDEMQHKAQGGRSGAGRDALAALEENE